MGEDQQEDETKKKKPSPSLSLVLSPPDMSLAIDIARNDSPLSSESEEESRGVRGEGDE